VGKGREKRSPLGYGTLSRGEEGDAQKSETKKRKNRRETVETKWGGKVWLVGDTVYGEIRTIRKNYFQDYLLEEEEG